MVRLSITKKQGYLVKLFIPLIILFSSSIALFVVGAEITPLERLNGAYGCDFEAGRVLTREEACTVIAKAFAGGESNGNVVNPPFEDLEEMNAESLPYIAALYNRGVLSGSAAADGKLYMLPDSEITRQEVFTLLGKTIAVSSQKELAFTDAASVAPWAYEYVSWFAENKIVNGYTDGRLAPYDNMTAEHFAIFLLKALEYEGENPVNRGVGEVYTLYGLGSQGLVDGDVKTAKFMMPYGVAVDKAGGLTVFDTYNNAIRTADAGMVSTLTGSVKSLDDYRMPKSYYLDGELETALFGRPTNGVYNSKGELLICDSENHVIRLLRSDRSYTFAGAEAGYADGKSKDARFNTPMAIAIDEQDNIYVADTLNNCVRRIDDKGNSSTIAGVAGSGGFADGDAKNALFLEPSGIAVSEDGKVIYVSDTGNQRIRKIENNIVSTIAGASTEKDSDGYYLGGFYDGAASEAEFNQPAGLALADGVLVVADSGNNKIRAITESGSVVTIAGDGESGDVDGNPQRARLNQPMGVCVYNQTLYIADTINNKIKHMQFDPSDFGEVSQ